MVSSKSITFSTNGNDDMIDITDRVEQKLKESKINSGVVTIFIPGSTGALTTIEYESGLIADLQEILNRMVPRKKSYKHNLKWHDDNGHSHIRASLIGPSVTVPFNNKSLTLGTWQQIIFIDFDIHPRQRKLILQIIGE